MIDISGIPKHVVLARLYAKSIPLGMGRFHFIPNDLPKAEAEDLVSKYSYFDYLHGRVMKVDISDDELDPYLYDRDNGNGAAEKALSCKVSWE